MDIGFIGVGTMGQPMARHLQQGGHRLHLVRNVSEIPAGLVEAGARVCESAGAVAAAADVVVLMVPDTPDVEQVLFADDGVAAGLTKGKTVIDMSSISPVATKEFAERIEALACDYVDAPVSGGEAGAIDGTLTIMVGAREPVFRRVRPLLELMGGNITRVGEIGAGQTCKVANQIIVALTIEAVAEGLVFAARAGADPARVREALLGGFASSRILEVHGERMLKRTFAPGFRIELHQKDLNLALSGARELGLSLPNTAVTQQLFSACVAAGGAALDHSALVTALERLANTELGRCHGSDD